MSTIFLEPGGDATFDVTTFWANVGGLGASVATDFVHGAHIKSLKFRAANNDQLEKDGVLADAGTRVSFYIYLNAAPAATPNVPILFNNSTNANTVFALNFTTGRVLQVLDNNGTQLGSNGATIPLGTWTRISVAYTITSTTVNTIKIFVNGTLSITLTNVTLTGTGTANFLPGNTLTDTTLDFRLSDIYIDNSSALTDPATDVWVTAKRLFSNGTSNQFTTQIGTGGSGYGTGHAPQVNERPLSTTNGWSLTNTTKSTEEYNIESASTGDIDISAATIIDYMGWIYTQVNSTANTPVHHIIVNNVATAITETTSAKLFTQAAGSTTYPAGTGTDIGIDAQYTTTGHLTSLFEAGIIFAYTPGVAVSTPKLGTNRLLLGVGT